MKSSNYYIKRLKYRTERFPLIESDDPSVSSLACISMVSNFHGIHVDFSELQRKASLKKTDDSISDVLNIAARVGLNGRVIKLKPSEISRLQTPCIFYWKERYVVLFEIKGNNLTIHDPIAGKIIATRADLEDFSAVVVELYPCRDFSKSTDKKLGIFSFYKDIKGVKTNIILIFLMSLIVQIFTLSVPFVLQTVIDRVIPTDNTRLLSVLMFGFIYLMVIEVITKAVRHLFTMYFFTKLNIDTLSNLFGHLIRLPMSYFHGRNMGDIASRFGSLEQLNIQISKTFITFVVDGVTALAMITIMALYNVKLSIITVGFMLLYLLVRVAGYRRVRVLLKQSLEEHAKSSTYFQETFRAIQSIKIFQKENVRHDGWVNTFIGATNKELQKGRVDLIIDLVSGIIIGCETIVIIFLISKLVMMDQMTIGMLYAYMSYKMQFSQRFDAFVRSLFDIKLLGTHVNRVSDIVLREKDPVDLHILSDRSDNFISGELKVRDLTHAYDASQSYVFRNLNFEVLSGEVVAIIGPSGQGKTTLLKIMMGLIEPTSGLVSSNGINIKDIPTYRKNISAVMQDDNLVHGTIIQNIMWFETGRDIEFAIYCAKIASIHDEILKLPDQYYSLVGDLGSSLSGGQKQRIMLARALFKKPKILFLDEATSNLDLVNERNVNNHIKELNITRVIVAHRQETINSADKIIDITNGEVRIKHRPNVSTNVI